MNYDLVEEGEIRFGPRFFSLIIEGIHSSNRVFGEDIYESDNDKYIVLQEWLSTDYSKGPITRPLIIDKEKMTFATLSEGKKGFASSFYIKTGFFQYRQINKGTGITKEYGCNLVDLNFVNIENM